MIDLERVVFLLGIALTIAGFWTWFVLWREFFCDRYRQTLFLVRDELFDYAHRGGIPFDSQEYAALRDMVNGAIRFAHKMSTLSLLWVSMFRSRLFRTKDPEFADERLKMAKEKYPDAFKLAAHGLAISTIHYLVKTSLLLRFVTRVVGICINLRRMEWRVTIKLLSRPKSDGADEYLADRIESIMDEVGVLGSEDIKAAA